MRAQLQTRNAYEPFAAEEVGRIPPGLALGKHSGSASIIHALRRQGVEVSREQAWTTLERVRMLATRDKSPVSAASVLKIFQSTLSSAGSVADIPPTLPSGVNRTRDGMSEAEYRQFR